MNTRKHIHWGSLILIGVFCFASCKMKRPDTVLSDAKMEAVLYDYHIAKTMGEQLPYNENYKRTLYIESVFKKHGITEAEFDTSMVWLAHNPEVLRDIYERINERLKAKKEVIDDLIAIQDNKPKESKAGDSIDVWAWQRVYQLIGMPFDNKMAFTLPSDANFQNRDTLRWSMRFHFRGGNPLPDSLYCPVMGMQVFYEKDSVVNSIHKVLRPGGDTISLWADTLGKIEKVYGFVYYPRQLSSQSMLLIDKVSLMRYHAKDSLPQTEAPVEKAKPTPVILEKPQTKSPARSPKSNQVKPLRPAEPHQLKQQVIRP